MQIISFELSALNKDKNIMKSLRIYKMNIKIMCKQAKEKIYDLPT